MKLYSSFRPTLKHIPNIKHVIMIASGKGGVGKSTVAVNVSIALSLLGKKVGLLDADVHGSSIPQMMYLDPIFNTGEFFVPRKNYNVECMSISFITQNPELPVVWRGLMVTKAIQQLLFQTAWSPLDFLVIDTPPGTGDAHLTIAQNISLSGSIIVSTGQLAALNIVQKGMEMLKKVNVPFIGWVKNMSWYKCDSCQHMHQLFDSVASTEFMETNNVPLLGDLPMVPQICASSDMGIPVMVQEGTHSLLKLQKEQYMNIANRVIKSLEG